VEILRTPNQDCVVMFSLVDALNAPAFKVGATGITTECVRYTSTSDSDVSGLTVTEHALIPGIYKLVIPAVEMIQDSSLLVIVSADDCEPHSVSISTDVGITDLITNSIDELKLLITDIDPSKLGTGDYDYAYDLLVPFRRLISAAILQNRITMDTANIATPHRMAYLSFINQLNDLSKILNALPTTSTDTTFTLSVSPTLLLSVLSSVTIQNYMNSGESNVDQLATSTSDYHVYMSKISSAAIVMHVDTVWYTTWGKQR